MSSLSKISLNSFLLFSLPQGYAKIVSSYYCPFRKAFDVCVSSLYMISVLYPPCWPRAWEGYGGIFIKTMNFYIKTTISTVTCSGKYTWEQAYMYRYITDRFSD